MTRKDYILIAAALRDAVLINCPSSEYADGVSAACQSATRRMADALAKDNARFDRQRFLTAAGYVS
jgi:hypothetical protein